MKRIAWCLGPNGSDLPVLTFFNCLRTLPHILSHRQDDAQDRRRMSFGMTIWAVMHD
jgi:hypothetical protein